MSQLNRTFVLGLILAIILFLLLLRNGTFNIFISAKGLIYHFSAAEEGLCERSSAVLTKLDLTPKKPVVINDPQTGVSKKIHGSFLHMTDFHPKLYFLPGSDITKACHLRVGKASKYEDPILGCDYPMNLVHRTIDWI